MSQSEPSITLPDQHVPLVTKIVYGTGDWGMASFNTIRQLFYAIFLTDIVGIQPALASFAVLIGAIWDAVNDPLIGALSDRVHTRWGRRRPFLLIFAIPFGAAFMLLWWAPPWESQVILMLHVTAAYMIADTLQTLITVPYLSLTPELTEDYDERTSLTTWRMIFNLMASLATAVAAPEIVNSAPTPQQGYLLMAVIFGILGALPYFGIFLVARERREHLTSGASTVLESFKAAWQNVPFRIATGINLLNWVTFDLVGLMIPFFLTYWIEGGSQRAEVQVPGLGSLAIESIIFFILLVTALITLPFWSWLAHRWSKRNAYIAGMVFWAGVQLLIFSVGPGERGKIMLMAFLAGISVSTAHVLPDALFPDILEWDELRTGKRHEGMYYGVKSFIRKITGAIAIFIALQTLGLFGYQTPPAGSEVFQQSPETLTAIRLLTGPGGAVFLLGAIALAFFYPISRERHTRMRRLLMRRRAHKNHPLPETREA
ncbi:MAG: MFS transporter [Anaerolineae bacterium]